MHSIARTWKVVDGRRLVGGEVDGRHAGGHAARLAVIARGRDGVGGRDARVEHPAARLVLSLEVDLVHWQPQTYRNPLMVMGLSIAFDGLILQKKMQLSVKY